MKVPREFLMEYERACYGFLYQRVFCPVNRKIVSLHNIPEQLVSSPSHRDTISTCIGSVIDKDTHEKKILFDDCLIDHDIHLKQAMGELDPYDYTKRLISREKVLQLTSKSDMASNSGANLLASQSTNQKKRKLPRKSIDSFFKPTNPHIRTNALKNSSTTVSSFNLGVSAIPIFIDKQVETVKKRRLTTNNYENIQISSNIKSTSKFFEKSRENKAILKADSLQLLDATLSKSTLNSSQVSTTIEDSVPAAVSDNAGEKDDIIAEFQLSTDIPSLLSVQDGDIVGISFSTAKPVTSSNKIALESSKYNLKAKAMNSSDVRNVTKTQDKLMMGDRSKNRTLEISSRSSDDLPSSQCETDVNEVINSDTTEDMFENDNSSTSSSIYKAHGIIYSKKLTRSFGMNHSNSQISSKISSLQSYRYSSDKSENTTTNYPLKSRDINSKDVLKTTLKSGKGNLRQKKSNLDGNIIKTSDVLQGTSRLGLRRRKTYNGSSSISKNNDIQINEDDHSFNSSIGYSQSSIHIRIKRKSGSIGNSLDSDTSVRRSTSSLSQFMYKGK